MAAVAEGTDGFLKSLVIWSPYNASVVDLIDIVLVGFSVYYTLRYWLHTDTFSFRISTI